MGDAISSLLFQPPPPTRLKESKVIWLTNSHGKRIPAFFVECAIDERTGEGMRAPHPGEPHYNNNNNNTSTNHQHHHNSHHHHYRQRSSSQGGSESHDDGGVGGGTMAYHTPKEEWEGIITVLLDLAHHIYAHRKN